MADKSAIEWTEATWNPVTGCTKLSPACSHCYIERTIPFRTRGRVFVKGHIPIELHPNRLPQPLKKKAPTVYFVNSLSDLFHDDIPDDYIDKVFAVMALTPQHTYQVLTKRPERMRAYMLGRSKNAKFWKDAARTLGYALEFQGISLVPFPLPNVWLGVSVENQRFAAERIPLLIDTPAAVRFLSCEPLLGQIDLVPGWLMHLDWIIGGGESGPIVRPTRIEWARSLRDQAVAAGVWFFWKQNGGRTSKSGGRLLDGRTWDEMPERATSFPARFHAVGAG